MIVSAWNPSTDNLEKTFLSGAAQRGVVAIKVRNTDRLTTDKFLLLGDMGYEQSELVKISSFGTNPTADVNLDSPIKFTHISDEVIFSMRYDQVEFHRSDDGPDGTYTLVNTSTIDVDNRDKITYYNDTNGTGSSYYRTRYRNSITNAVTEFSDYINADGAEVDTIGSVVDFVIKRVGDPGFTVLPSDVYIGLAQEVNDDLISQSERPYSFLRQTRLLDVQAGDTKIQLPSNYSKFNWIKRMTQAGGVASERRLFPIPLNRFQTNTSAVAATDTISRIALDDDAKYILLNAPVKSTRTGVLKLNYYGEFDTITDFSNKVQTPNTLIYRYKFLAEFYSKRSDRDPLFRNLYNDFNAKYGNEVMKMQRMNRRDVGSPRDFMSSQRNNSIDQTPRKRFYM